MQRLLQHEQRDQREGHADVEAPAPAEPAGVGDDTAEQRAADGRDGEGGAEVAGVASALTRGDHRGHDDLGQGGQTAGAQSLDGTRADQHRRVLCQSGHDGAEDEDAQGYLDQDLLAEQVGELAPQGGGSGHRQQRGGDDPGVGALAAAEVAHDLGQGVGDDGRRQDGGEHAEQQPGQRLHDLPVGHRSVSQGASPVLGMSPHTGGCGRCHGRPSLMCLRVYAGPLRLREAPAGVRCGPRRSCP